MRNVCSRLAILGEVDGYQVEITELRAGAKEIASAIGQADHTKLESVSGKGAAYGDGAVAGAVSAFCTTWELAKQILQQRSASAGEALEGTATVYEQQEHRGAQTFGPH